MAEETKKKKILLVEDDVFMLDLLSKDLEAAGLDVANPDAFVADGPVACLVRPPLLGSPACVTS